MKPAPVPPPNRTLGYRVLTWIERYLCHGPGEVQGRPLQIDDEFSRFVLRAYAIDGQGRRLIRRAVLSRPKGRAKSELAAALACAECLGPVRFGGWGADGEPIGRPPTGPEVLCVATEEGQAGNTYRAAAYMLQEGPIASAPEYDGLDVGLTRTYTPGGGLIAPVTAAARSADGRRSTFVVFDETHLYATPALRDLHETILRNLSKRAETWGLETSTMYAPGEESVAEASHDTAERIAEGTLTAPWFLFDHRQAPVDFAWDDDTQLRAAIAHAYGEGAAWIDLDGIVALARDPARSEAAVRRFWLNQPASAPDAFVTRAQWDACEVAGAGLEDGEEIAVGFDGSRTDDATALVGVSLAGPPIRAAVLGLWQVPPGAPEGTEVDRDDVDRVVGAMAERYRVARLFADPWLWREEIGRWHREPWGRDGVVAELDTRIDSRMAPAGTNALEVILRGNLAADDPRLTRHILNARARWIRPGVTLRKERRGSPRKIDAAVALILALEARRVALDKGTRRKRAGRFHGFANAEDAAPVPKGLHPGQVF